MIKINFIILFFVLSINISSKNVVSLAPNITDILYYLNYEKNIVGIDKFSKEGNGKIVGDFFNIDYEKILKLKPKYVFLLKSDKKNIKILKKIKLNPIAVKINNLKDINREIEKISKLLNIKNVNYIPVGLIKSFSHIIKKKKKAIFIVDREVNALNNIYLAGKNNFINEYMEILGFENLIKDKNYPKVDIEIIIKLNPEVIIELNSKVNVDVWKKYPMIKAFKNKKIFKINKKMSIPSPFLFEELSKFRKKYGI